MATTTVTETTRATNGNGAGNGKGPEAAEAKPYKGKEHKWAITKEPLFNHRPGMSNIHTILAISAVVLFNKSEYGKQWWARLNENYTPFEINAWGSVLITFPIYFGFGLVFMAFDMIPALNRLVKPYRIQPTPIIPLKEYLYVIYINLRNWVFVNTPLYIAIAYFYPLKTDVASLPGWGVSFGTFLFAMLCEEVGFFYVHRFFHGKRWYAYVHKLHHQYTAPVALAAEYCTMVEHLLSNLFPLVISFIILKSHWSMFMLFFNMLQFDTLAAHSDYNIPFLADALVHDWHHYSYTENYGPFGLLDALHGHSIKYKEWLGEIQRRDNEDPDWRFKARRELAKRTPAVVPLE
ncbi:C-4 sterol methyl oxidase [Vanrija albida]|uniref:C-4 sterol methyl oxidase n=1 Tax=Vanrija albida TaxID=181172 RepID=A0ABR3PVW8_9TREE